MAPAVGIEVRKPQRDVKFGVLSLSTLITFTELMWGGSELHFY